MQHGGRAMSAGEKIERTTTMLTRRMQYLWSEGASGKFGGPFEARCLWAGDYPEVHW